MQGYSDFGLKSRMVMIQKRITAVAIAKELGVSATYVSEILKGTRPGNGKREQIAKILGLEEELAREKEAVK